jgi:hypothetical protein
MSKLRRRTRMQRSYIVGSCIQASLFPLFRCSIIPKLVDLKWTLNLHMRTRTQESYNVNKCVQGVWFI